MPGSLVAQKLPYLFSRFAPYPFDLAKLIGRCRKNSLLRSKVPQQFLGSAWAAAWKPFYRVLGQHLEVFRLGAPQADP